MKRFLALVGCTLLFAVFTLCQSSSSFSSDQHEMHGSMGFGPLPSHIPTITGAPYSAEEIDVNVQTLADGTHIRRTTPGRKIYRDSMGRTRSERQPFSASMEGMARAPIGPTIVEINDPVAHVRYVFDLSEPVTHRQELHIDESRDTTTQAQPAHTVLAPPTISAPADANAAAAKGGLDPAPTTAKCADILPAPQKSREPEDPSRPQTTREDLGTQVIEGIPAKGTRHTTTYPVGSAGNDRPFTTISESWMSPDLKETILSKNDDPRYGENTHKLVNISRSEPDPSLFEPPPNYTVKDEKGEFKINWSAVR